MKYTPEEVLLYLKEEDVKFVRMSFCDPFGRQKNVAIMADELPRAFEYGIGFDASAIDGFNGEVLTFFCSLIPLHWWSFRGVRSTVEFA